MGRSAQKARIGVLLKVRHDNGDLFKSHVRRYIRRSGSAVTEHERRNGPMKHADILRHETDHGEDIHEGAVIRHGDKLISRLTDKKWKHKEVPAVHLDPARKAKPADKAPTPPTIPGKNKENSALISAQRTIDRMHEAAKPEPDPVAALMAFNTSRANPYLKAVDDYRTALLQHFGYSVNDAKKHIKLDNKDHTIILEPHKDGHKVVFAASKEGPRQTVASAHGKIKKETVEIKGKAGGPSFIYGDDNDAYTAKMNKIRSKFALVDIADLTTSHNYDGHVNTAYPQEIQPRDRARITSRLQIQTIAADLKPELYGITPQTSDGAPIVGKDGIVESGNGRTLALGLAYKNKAGEEYRNWLKGYAAKVGIDLKTIEGMDMPMLVRVRETEVDRPEFAREANQSNLMHSSPVETAFSDAERISDSMLTKYQPDETGDVLAPDNRPFVAAFLDTLGKNEAAGMLDRHGDPNRKLVDRIQAAVFAKVYKSEVLTELMVESADNDVRNIINAMNVSAGDYAKIQKHSDLDITSDLLDAIDHIRTAKRNNSGIDEQLDQATFDDNGNVAFVDPVTEKVTRAIHKRKGSRRQLVDYFKELTSLANREIVEREDDAAYGGDMFGGSRAKRTKKEILDEADREKVSKAHRTEAGAYRIAKEEVSSPGRDRKTARRKVQEREITLPLLLKAAWQLQGRIDFNGLPISVETRMGSIRQWYDPHTDQTGMTRMLRPYGYIKGTLGSDGDHYDVYVGPHRDAQNVYIVTQKKAPDFTEYDEEKALLGFRTQADARHFYLQHYDDPRFLGKITIMPFEEFKEKVMRTRETNGRPLVKAEFEHAFTGMKADRKLTKTELARAIRQMIAAEYEAVQLYEQLAESIDDDLTAKVLLDIADEEKVHAGEFLEVLKRIDPKEAEHYREGAAEVKQVGSMKKAMQGIYPLRKAKR